ncbi:O-antigen ligase family protein [Micromonospora phytophila]|uniref:O-antigen ligase family protein n=1 Tax=Micromonospora phytophila TaxID=709888 RepID=UPI002030613C|nr:O-antigen ligase family protein [Micromonospora phytophila]MCM0675384.1 O-antigen ligase family protein [Micromonospora phytophila]
MSLSYQQRSDLIAGINRWEPPVPVRTARPGVSVTLVTALFVVALAGRISPDRAGLPMIGFDDLRKPACVVLLGAAILWQANLWARGAARPWPPFFGAFTALIAVQLLAALWAPFGARVDQAVWDLGLLWVVVLLATAFTAGDPRRAARVLLVLMLVAGLAYAVGALHAGPQVGGRLSAFGGGPNVFVRVVSLGMIAAVTLAAVSRRWWFLLPVPLLGTAAVLSGSRGGLVALIGAATVFLVFFARRRASILVGTLVIGGLASWLVWSVVGDAFVSVAESRYSTAGIQQGGFSVRPELLSVAWQMFLEHPLAGAGMDSFYATSGIGYPHNYLAGLAAETGVLALGLVVFAAFRWWWDGRPWSAAPLEQIGCAVGAVYILLASMFSGDYYDTRFCWILAVVAVGRDAPMPRQVAVVGFRGVGRGLGRCSA